MGIGSAADWFLDRDGSRSGPFSAEQIQKLLGSGEITDKHRVTAEWLCGEWITVADLIAGYQAAHGTAAPSTAPSVVPSSSRAAASARPPAPAPVPPSAAAPTPPASASRSSGPFHPPPRPAELDAQFPEIPVMDPNERTETDPALELFDVLQAARERKSGGRNATPPPLTTESIAESDEPLWKRVPPRIWGLAGAVIAGVLLVGFLVNRMTPSTPTAPTAPSNSEIAAERPQTATGFKSGGADLSRPAPAPRAAAPVSPNRVQPGQPPRYVPPPPQPEQNRQAYEAPHNEAPPPPPAQEAEAADAGEAKAQQADATPENEQAKPAEETAAPADPHHQQNQSDPASGN